MLPVTSAHSCCMPKDKNGTSARFTWTLGRPKENHADLLAAVEQYGLQRTLGQAMRYRLGVIIDELVSNATSHGRCGEEQQMLSVAIADHPKELVITLIDNGLPFDPTSHALTPCPEKGTDIPIGGVGLCLVRRLADRMQYSRNDHRNHLSIFLDKNKSENPCSCRK